MKDKLKKKHKNRIIAEPIDEELYGKIENSDESLNNESDNIAFFDLDLNELDKACALHPKLYHEYAIRMPQARKKLEEAEAELKVIKAEVDRLIRDNPSKYNLADKPTEASISSTVFLQPAYKKIQARVIESQYRVNMIDAMLKSIDRKGSMIDNAVKLHGQDYFSPIHMDADNSARITEQRSNKVAKMCQKNSRR